MTDKKGRSVFLSIEIDVENYNDIEIDAIIVSSVYCKDRNPSEFLEKTLNEYRVLYWNKKMSQDLFNTPELQLPDNIKHLNFNVIICKISENVNTQSESNSKKQYCINSDIDKYTESQYNNLGRTNVNDVLPSYSEKGEISEYADFNEKYANAKFSATKPMREQCRENTLSP